LHCCNPAGYDFINTAEATAGAVMSAAGYRTAQYGKWHNCDVLGYEPWNVGFDQGACLGLAATSAPDASRLMRWVNVRLQQQQQQQQV
jgi:arylsulfatase A-like enzyme